MYDAHGSCAAACLCRRRRTRGKLCANNNGLRGRMKVTDVTCHILQNKVEKPFTSARGWLYGTRSSCVRARRWISCSATSAPPAAGPGLGIEIDRKVQQCKVG
jgi:hypothetical protein